MKTKQFDVSKVEFFSSLDQKPDGSPHFIRVGVGPGPTLWSTPYDLRLTENICKRLDFSKGPIAFQNGSSVFVSVRAVAESCPDPVLRRKLLKAFRENLRFFQKKLQSRRRNKGLTNSSTTPARAARSSRVATSSSRKA